MFTNSVLLSQELGKKKPLTIMPTSLYKLLEEVFEEYVANKSDQLKSFGLREFVHNNWEEPKMDLAQICIKAIQYGQIDNIINNKATLHFTSTRIVNWCRCLVYSTTSILHKHINNQEFLEWNSKIKTECSRLTMLYIQKEDHYHNEKFKYNWRGRQLG